MNTLQIVIDAARRNAGWQDDRMAAPILSACDDLETADHQVLVTLADPYAEIRTIVRDTLDENMHKGDALRTILDIVGDYERKPQVIVQGVTIISPPEVMFRSSPGGCWSPSFATFSDPFAAASYHVGEY